MDIDALRKNYRLRLNGANDQGIAILDLVGAFGAAYYLEQAYSLSDKLPVSDSEKVTLYYLLVLPLGIFAHYIFKVDSFLTRELIKPGQSPYKILFIVIFLSILKSTVLTR